MACRRGASGGRGERGCNMEEGEMRGQRNESGWWGLVVTRRMWGRGGEGEGGVDVEVKGAGYCGEGGCSAVRCGTVR